MQTDHFLDVPITSKVWLSPSEVCYLVDCIESRLRHWREGSKPKHGPHLADPVKFGGRYRYRVSDVLLYLRAVTEEPAQRLAKLLRVPQHDHASFAYYASHGYPSRSCLPAIERFGCCPEQAATQPAAVPASPASQANPAHDPSGNLRLPAIPV